MATEAIPDNIATTSISPDHELSTVETSQDVAAEQSVVNGISEKDDGKHDTEHHEPNVNSAEVSVNGGSDTEASKAETTKIQGDGGGHARTISTVKKPTSFKTVSVNKTFLAAKGTTPATLSKLGDKGAAGLTAGQTGPAATLTARPRLVAKSGSGLRDSAPKNAAAANGGKPGAPDASAVWNKNRPAPPPEPKRFTDEELKQRYGIHLATRLQSDEPGKQANWADIDDEDEDWAPEAIEWNDGTKITLPLADETPAPTPEPLPAVIVNDVVPEATKPKSPAPTQASASPTVRLGGFGGRAGLVLKGAAEKPTLVAKPPGPPTPVKSPWAALPPVEKVAPVPIEIPQQQQQPPPNRFAQRDPHGFQSMPPPPTKEIAADDFSRSSWREGQATNRELYNSQSGRYEPVNDNRRGSLRNDVRAHQPAVLQRPSNQDGPAEPSAAFQTRGSGHDGAYSRRRTSSNVSGGSGNLVRRLSRGDMPPPQDSLTARRSSLAAVSDEAASPRNNSPSNQRQNSRGHHQPWQSRASPVISQNSPQSSHDQSVPLASASSDSQKQPPVAPVEDPLEVQKKVMQEKRALAIARRKEEEAREEAEKRERIALKLASMGPPPETKKKEAVKEERVAPTQIHSRDSDSVPAEKQVTSVEANNESNVKATETSPKLTIAPNTLDGASAEKELSLQTRPNGIHLPQEAQHRDQIPRDREWQNNSTPAQDRFKPWAPAPSQQSTSRNVWGPPTSDRTLGNGTFNPELSRVPEIHASSNPGPIGPPSRGQGQNQQGSARDQYNVRPAPIGPPKRHQVVQPDSATRAAVAKSGWGSLPSRIAQEDALMAAQQDLEKAHMQELRKQGVVPEIPIAPLQDTWQQVIVNEDGTRSKVQKNVTLNHGDEAQSRGAFEDQDNSQWRSGDAVSNQPQITDTWRSSSHANGHPPTRGSRFFPNNRDIRLDEQGMLPERPGSPSPPPPTMAGHPAYDGDIAHPHVSLPRPPPIVKLPPATVLPPIAPPKPVSFAAAVLAPAVPVVTHSSTFSAARASQYQDIRKQEPVAGGWQDKINSLIGRKNSPPRSFALAVDSASKNAFELPQQQRSATVALPSFMSNDLATEYGAVDSKPAAEECFEEQEMGSLPTIKLPRDVPLAALDLAAQPPKMLPRKFLVADTMGVEMFYFPPQITNNNLTIAVKVPGQEESKYVSLPVPPRQKSNPRRGGSRVGGGNPRHAPSSQPRGGRGRDSSSGLPSSNIDTAPGASSPNPMNRGGRSRGGYNHNSNWTRQVSTPIHT